MTGRQRVSAIVLRCLPHRAVGLLPSVGVKRLFVAFVTLSALVVGTPSALPAQPGNASGADESVLERRPEGDWGITLDALRSIRSAGHQDADAWTSAVSTALWGRRVIPVGELSRIDAALQGSYNWSSGQTYLNLDIARLRTVHPELFGPTSVVRTTAGRFRLQDPSRWVFDHVADGLSARLEYPSLRLRFAGAYTGFLLNPASTVRMTGTDLLEEDDEDEEFGPRRVVGLADLTLPELIGRQTFVVGAVGQLDLRDADDSEQTVDSGYALVGVRGPVLGRLYHDLYAVGTLGTYELTDQDGVTETEDYSGYLASARLRWFIPEFYSSRFSLRAVYAGREDTAEDEPLGGLHGYLPVTRIRLGTAVAVPLQNLLFGELAYSMRPFHESDSTRARRFQIQLAGRAFFTTSDQPLRLDPATELEGDEPDAFPGAQTDPDGSIIGYEGVVRINARLFSDLGLGVTTGMFFPETGERGVFSDDREPEFLGRIELSARF